MYKPNGYNSASPYLIVDGAEAAIDFLKRVLHAAELRRFDDENGRIIHAEIRIDDTVVMIADAAPPDWPAVASHVHLYVEDVDAVYEKAVREGATPVQKPVKKDDEDKRGGFRDPAGTTWWVATRVG